jgi:hypothetical protein
MEEKPGKLQIINYRVAIISCVIVVINLIIQWCQNQYPNMETNTPMYIYKIHEAIDLSSLLGKIVIVFVVFFALLSFTGVGMYQVSVKINLKIIGMFILTIIIYFILRSGNIMITIDKHMYDKDRVKVANMIINGEIGKVSKYEKFELPAEYKKLSRDHGQIIVRRENGNTWVYFTTYRGLSSGGSDSEPINTFVYCKEDACKLLPLNDEYTFNLVIIDFRKL